MHDVDHLEENEQPSRSARRREALDVLALAKQLIELPPSRIGKLELPDEVRDEIANVRKITSHIARKRQLSYLAKLMRRHDEEAFAPARASLANDREAGAREAAATHHLEALRERLLGEGDAALSELIAAHPDLDRQRLRALIRQARLARESNKPLHAYRELFRVLRELKSRDADEHG
ncbi:MAG TPA: ribosome biogenesis factor YjgA [Rhodanobacteraceae bacterium]|nr:ribosome biogenesis factor YjgA [Rhodanobacteraceae bacterium]